MAFDIAKTNLAVIAETGYTFKVELPDGTPTDFEITVRGSQAPKVKAHGKAVFNRLQVKEKAAKRQNKEVEFNLDEAEDMAVESAVVRIVTWTGLEEDGKVVKFTEENAKRIMRELDWVRKQVLDQADNAANFV